MYLAISANSVFSPVIDHIGSFGWGGGKRSKLSHHLKFWLNSRKKYLYCQGMPEKAICVYLRFFLHLFVFFEGSVAMRFLACSGTPTPTREVAVKRTNL